MQSDDPQYVNCGTHGKRVSAVVCSHMLQEKSLSVGFIENSDDPNDLQAWCYGCEEMFLAEGDKTPAFVTFCDMSIVCCVCYEKLKINHSTHA